MKNFGLSLLLGLVLVGLLLFTTWFRTPHQSTPQWQASAHHLLDEVEGFRIPERPIR